MMDDITPFIEKIYPEASEYVRGAMGTPALKVARVFPSPHNPGAFGLVDQPDFTVAYLAFERDVDDPHILSEIRAEMDPYYPPDKKPFWFNVFGRNPNGMRWVRQLGYRQDMLAYKMRYSQDEPPDLPDSPLEAQEFHPDEMGALGWLFDRSYDELNQKNGWKTNWNTTHPEAFARLIEDYLKNDGGVQLFRLDGELVGGYVYQGYYLCDIVVDPVYQNRGFGSVILTHALWQMLLIKETPEVRLNVAVNNEGAYRFYLRHGFEEIGCFADHSYVGEPEYE